MAYVNIGDYQYTTINDNEAKVNALAKLKTSYEDNILSSVYIRGQYYTVTDMSNCFNGCKYFNQSITIPDSITNMTSCFKNCDIFNQPIIIPDSVIYMEHCFHGCTDFNQPIIIPKNVMYMNYCFYDCNNFNSLIIFSDNAEVINMYHCFDGCSSFNQPIVMPKNVTNMQSCFYGCTSFNQSITIPNNVIYMECCFDSCTSFNQSVTIPKSVIDMRSCFRKCESFNSSVVFSNNAEVSDMSICFGYCKNFNQSITIPDSVTDMSYCFDSCINFNSPITFSDNAKVTNMSYCFKDCTSFNQSITIPDKVTNMTYCFKNCINFNSPIAFSDNAKVTNMGYCFDSCTSFNQSVTIPDKVTIMVSCFNYCTSLASNIIIKQTLNNKNNIFLNTTLPIYIVNDADPLIKDSVATYWREITSQYTNVHYETDDHNAPLINFEAKRVNSSGQSSSTGSYIYITKEITLNQDFIPYNFEPAAITEETLKINGTDRDPQLNIYDLGENYEQGQLIIYTINDGYKTATITTTVSKVTALLDFQGKKGSIYNDRPGMGMAIGKMATRNGLDINFPTTIGKDLIPPTKFDNYDEVENPFGNPKENRYYELIDGNYIETEDIVVNSTKTYYKGRNGTEYVDLENYQLVVGKHNKQNNNATFIIGDGEEDSRSNLMEVGRNIITIGDVNSTHQEISKNGTEYFDSNKNKIGEISLGDGSETQIKYEIFNEVTFEGSGSHYSYTTIIDSDLITEQQRVDLFLNIETTKLYSKTISDVDITSEINFENVFTITFTENSANNHFINIEYIGEEGLTGPPIIHQLKISYHVPMTEGYYTFGSRINNPGSYSFVNGQLNSATTKNSAVFGSNNRDTGDESFVIGRSSDILDITYNSKYETKEEVYYNNPVIFSNISLDTINDFSITVYENGDGSYFHFPLRLHCSMSELPSDRSKITIVMETDDGESYECKGNSGVTFVQDGNFVKFNPTSYCQSHSINITDIYYIEVYLDEQSLGDMEPIEYFFSEGTYVIFSEEEDNLNYVEIIEYNDGIKVTIDSSALEEIYVPDKFIFYYNAIMQESFPSNTAAFVVGVGDIDDPQNGFVVDWEGRTHQYLPLPEYISDVGMINLHFPIDRELTPSADRSPKIIAVKDINDRSLGGIQYYDYADSRSGISIYSHRPIDDTTVFNSLGLLIDANGNRKIKLEKEAWLAALVDSTVNLGTYVATGILTSSAGTLSFSIPTGRCFPKGTTLKSISFSILVRAGSNTNDTGGYYIVKKTNGGTDSVSFNSSQTFTFYDGANTKNDLLQSKITKNLQGLTNIYISMASGTTNYFAGDATITKRINNNPCTVYLTNIVATFNIPSN